MFNRFRFIITVLLSFCNRGSIKISKRKINLNNWYAAPLCCLFVSFVLVLSRLLLIRAFLLWFRSNHTRGTPGQTSFLSTRSLSILTTSCPSFFICSSSSSFAFAICGKKFLTRSRTTDRTAGGRRRRKGREEWRKGGEEVRGRLRRRSHLKNSFRCHSFQKRLTHSYTGQMQCMTTSVDNIPHRELQ